MTSHGVPAGLDIHDLFAELTQIHRHREAYVLDTTPGGTRVTLGHVTTVPSLLHQLEHATVASTGENGAGGFKSRPAAHLESLDTLIHIDLAAARWVRDLGEDDPGTTAACVRLLHGLYATAQPATQRVIEHDVRRWWAQARIVTGWDSPAWRPNNTCLACGVRGTLRIRLSSQSGMCIQCRETWGPETIGLLAEHIRMENFEDGEDVEDRIDDTPSGGLGGAVLAQAEDDDAH